MAKSVTGQLAISQRLDPPTATRLQLRGENASINVRHRRCDSRAAHVGFIANSRAEVDSVYAAAMAAGAIDNGKPSARLYYDPRYYAGNVFDPDGYSLEFVFKSWQHPKPKPRKSA